VMRVVYLSLGNIPSCWAHSVQMMKVSESLAKCFKEFTLVTGTGEKESEVSLDFLWRKYGIERPFNLWQVPLGSERHLNIFGLDNEKCSAKPLVDIAKSMKADLVFTRDISVAWDCVLANLRVVLELHSVPIAEKAPSDVVLFSKHPKLLGVITLTHHLKECYSAMGIPREKIMVQISGSCIPFGKERKKKENGNTVLYMGSLLKHKGAGFLVKLAKELPGYSFQIVGGESSQNVWWRGRCVAEECDNIEFFERISIRELPKLFKDVDLCVLPNRPDNSFSGASFPLKLMDYLSSGIPTVVSLTPCLMSTPLEHRKHLMMSEYNPVLFAETMEEVLNDHQLFNRLSCNALSFAREFSWDNRIKNILDFYVL
jgi:glycosyltransferase involved in cell wall biosynthesis